MVNILTIKGFDDNYFWLLKDTQSSRCVVVDPGDATPVLELIESQNLILESILLTHHHHDHTGGVKQLLTAFPTISVFSKSALFESSQQVKEGDSLTFFDGRFSLNVMETPGHTLDHVVYYNQENVFCGDLLFSGGCGRIFEGTYEQMFDSLSRVAMLNDNVNVYCAHEYTQNNLIFAHHIEPKNKALLDYIQWVAKKRQQGIPTLPTTIGREKNINPFLRCYEKLLINNLQAQLNKQLVEPIDCFRELRQYKDRF